MTIDDSGLVRFPVPRRDDNKPANPQGMTTQEIQQRLAGHRQSGRNALDAQIGQPGPTPGASSTPAPGRGAPAAPKQSLRGAGR